MPNSFEVLDARTIEEALLLLARYGREAKLIAGGTDILPKLKDGKVDVKYLINILCIPDLDRIENGSKGGLGLGVLATIQSLENSHIIKHQYPVLAEAAEQLGSPQIRNIATLGGNLCNASPAADMAPPLLVLEAKAIFMRKEERKAITIDDFFSDPSKTALSPYEMLVQIDVPAFPRQSGATYIKFGVRRAMDIALVGVAVFVQLDPEMENFQEVRISLGAVAPRPMRARRAEEILRGEKVQDSLIEKSGALASHEASPISDFRASASYRRDIVRILTIRGLKLALERARKCCH